jgi:hypothetical protein
MKTTVRIAWSREFDNKQMWNEVCAWAIEMFGLPGEKFETQANVNYMDFLFDSKLDAMIMCLKWNARIVSEDELTVEAVGRMMLMDNYHD